ncbi:hypothetical protein NP233_g10849 [Leucocoprinus birnbaumii]|uniref:Zn(2)-C6 fungal-type domain-containing protein n=1 Tax=Leucocoprinus birnbaumii TaxID=56174 RepID=A0AAD5VHH3_9AGAR|nr:hypothetical protein NP233_g10849 [Leucocoprinus birnbaumii]
MVKGSRAGPPSKRRKLVYVDVPDFLVYAEDPNLIDSAFPPLKAANPQKRKLDEEQEVIELEEDEDDTESTQQVKRRKIGGVGNECQTCIAGGWTCESNEESKNGIACARCHKSKIACVRAENHPAETTRLLREMVGQNKDLKTTLAMELMYISNEVGDLREELRNTNALLQNILIESMVSSRGLALMGYGKKIGGKERGELSAVADKNIDMAYEERQRGLRAEELEDPSQLADETLRILQGAITVDRAKDTAGSKAEEGTGGDEGDVPGGGNDVEMD